ncbi:MAG: nitroreductase family protein, partial [candidate division NC10 bacterium]|nr:nitroreductase family protein [candidate division NC10 bacterium]
MEIPASRWFEAIERRRSTRRYEGRPVEPKLLQGLAETCGQFKPFPHARAVLVQESPDEVFRGAIGSYGKIKGASAFIAFLGEMDSPHVQEEVGYQGEGIILEATALDLATCWVGAFFRPEVAASLAGTQTGERVLAVTPLGYPLQGWSLEERIMAGFGRNHHRKPLTEIVEGWEEKKVPDWMRIALDAARFAPSAVNRQPWRFQLEPGGITVSVDSPKDTFHISKRLDCGIAMLHLEV